MSLRKRRFIVISILLALLLIAVGGIVSAQRENLPWAPGADVNVVKFDVAESASRFVFDEEPVFDDGFPAYGNAFVTQGYIYPHGTLDGSNGVLPNGEPEFPDKVIGEWTCRGWFVGDGAHTESGPWVITTQVYDLGDAPGDVTLVSEGYELADVNESVQRAITGGTGRTGWRKAQHLRSC